MKIGVIGCGLIGRKRMLAMPEHQLVVAADIIPERARALVSEFGGKATGDWNQVVASDAEIIVVATTHDLLASLALEAVRAGKHVLLEKPGGRSASELEPLAREADARNLLVKVGFNHRFHPALLKARSLVDEGALGPLFFIRGRYGHGGRVGYEKEWRFKPEISGGGELLDQGCHLIDLAGWFLGDFSRVSGVLPTYFWDSPVEDNCFLTLGTDQEQVAWLHASWTEWKNMFSMEIYGRDGKLHIEGLGGSYGLERLSFYRMLPQMGPPETTIWEYPFPDNSWKLEVEELLSAIRENRQPVGNVHEAIKTLGVLDRVYAQNRKTQQGES